MGRRFGTIQPIWITGMAILGFLAVPGPAMAGPSSGAVAAFNSYIEQVESRIQKQHLTAATFVVPQDWARLRNGQQLIEEVKRPEGSELPGAMLHHWRGTAFVPGAKAADFERLMKDFDAYPRIYAPQVVQTRILSGQGDHFQFRMRTRQKHVITVVMDLTLDITFGQLDGAHHFSFSRSNRISEIQSAGTANERALGPDQDHGFLWRLNTYWSCAERDGGLYMQIESVSLSRSIPAGLGWVVKPFVESVPRESLEFTLKATSNSLRK